MVAGYVAPATSKICTRAIVHPFQHLAEAVTYLSTNTTLPIVGLTDINARIGTRIPANVPLSWNRENAIDRKRDARGAEFNDLCYDTDMVVLNGLQIATEHRTFSFDNSFTSFQSGGTSVVDYAFLSQSLLSDPSLVRFSTGSTGPADHTPLTVSIPSTETIYMPVNMDNSAPKINDLREEMRAQCVGPLDNDLRDILDTAVSMSPCEADQMHLYGASCPCIRKQSNIPCFDAYIVSPPNNPRGHRLLTAAIHWGLHASRNRTLAYGTIPNLNIGGLDRRPVYGPAKQRVLLAAVAVTVASLGVDSPLQIIVDCQDIIDLVCYEAPLHAVKGWTGPNDDILKMVVDCLSERRATTEFVLYCGHTGNVIYNEALADARAVAHRPGSSPAHMGRAEIQNGWTYVNPSSMTAHS